MNTLGLTGLKWLKGFHLIAVCCWIGGGTALVLLYFLKNGVTDGSVLYGINKSIHFVDMAVIVIPGAFGCLITGLIYGIFTKYGFFRHGWMIFKWVVTVGAILFGTFYLGPWETEMMNISSQLGMASLEDPAYLYNQRMNIIFGALQVLLLLVTVFISIFKPWKRKNKKK